MGFSGLSASIEVEKLPQTKNRLGETRHPFRKQARIEKSRLKGKAILQDFQEPDRAKRILTGAQASQILRITCESYNLSRKREISRAQR